MKPVALVKTRVNNQVGSQTAAEVVGECGAAVIGGAAVAAGIWAVACVVAGLMVSGGPIALVRNWFIAVSGV